MALAAVNIGSADAPYRFRRMLSGQGAPTIFRAEDRRASDICIKRGRGQIKRPNLLDYRGRWAAVVPIRD